MSNCCSSHQNKVEERKEEKGAEKEPKSFIGRYLYKIGKEDFEKGKHKKRSCC